MSVKFIFVFRNIQPSVFVLHRIINTLQSLMRHYKVALNCWHLQMFTAQFIRPKLACV